MKGYRVFFRHQFEDIILKKDLEKWIKKRIEYHKTHNQDERYYVRLEELLEELEEAEV